MPHTVEGVSFEPIQFMLGRSLLEAPEVKVPEWQSLDVTDKPMGITHELQNVVIELPIPHDRKEAQEETACNMPWAEEHFLERVSGEPLNPPPSAANWPFAQKGHVDHTDSTDGKFSHTYPERMWPKYAGDVHEHHSNHIGSYETTDRGYRTGRMMLRGIRFDYGDLDDVVQQLKKSPLTRQAYLPIWFPEDTGAVHGERVPCSLGYHFLIREGKLNVTYFIRSVDFIRHFPDDVYMAMRLGQWMRDRLQQRNRGIATIPDSGTLPMPDPLAFIDMGTLTMHMVSLHVFGGDRAFMESEYA